MVFMSIPVNGTRVLAENALFQTEPMIAAEDHTVVLKSDGTVWTFGWNIYGQLGDGTTTDKSTPVQVKDLTGVTAIAAKDHTVALKSNGTVWTFGSNDYGQLGDGTMTDKSTPVQVKDLTGVTAIAAGSEHTAVLKNDGTVWTFGSNFRGKLGDGTTTDKSTPVQVKDLTGVTAIAAGYHHTVALKSDGTVWTFGYNWYGQLGDGTWEDKSTPVQVKDLTGVTAIAGGLNHAAVLKSDGTVWTFGSNGDGQLGDGTTTDKSTPVQVMTGVTAIAAGGGHTVALKSDGTVWTFGSNFRGQLGDGTTTGKSTPIQVKELTGVTGIAAGRSYTVVLKSDGTVWTFGYNEVGQLGDGTTTSKCTPVQVLGAGGVGYLNLGENSGSGNNSGNNTDDPGDDSNSEVDLKLGMDTEFTVPGDIPIIGGGKVKLDFKNIPIQFEQDGDTFRVGIGCKKDLLSKDDKTSWFSFKKFVETQNRDIEKGLNSLLASKFGKASMGMKGSVEIKCFGYIEGVITDGRIKSSGGKAFISIKGKASQEWQTMVVVVPVVIKATGEVGAEIKASLGFDFENSEVYFEGSLDLTLPKIKVSAGVGVAYVADISVYGSAENKISISPNTVTAGLTGEMGVSAKLLFLSYEQSLLKGTWQYYPRSKGIAFPAVPNEEYADSSNYTIDRSYLNNRSEWLGADGQTGRKAKDAAVQNTVRTLRTSIYDATNPKVICTDQGDKMMVYTDDIETRETGNHTAVLYSVCNAGSSEWSQPRIIEDDGTADFSPDIVTDGSNIYVAWMDSKVDNFTVESSLEEIAASCEIQMAQYRMEDDSFTGMETLTDTSFVNMYPVLSASPEGVYVAWFGNSENDMLSLHGTNTVYYTEYKGGASPVNEYISYSGKAITSLDIGLLEGTPSIAFTLDEDGDVTTTDNVNLYVGRMDESPSALTEGTGLKQGVQFSALHGIEILSWYEDDAITYTENLSDFSQLLTEDTMVTSNYQIISGIENDMLICTSDSDGGSDIYAWIIENGVASGSIPVTAAGGYVRHANGFLEDGSYYLAFTRTDVSIGEESVDESTDLCITTISPYHKLGIESVAYKEEDVVPGQNLPLSITLSNHGFMEESDYVISVNCEGNQVHSQRISELVAVGETKEVTVDLPIPTGASAETTYIISVLPSNGLQEDVGIPYEIVVGRPDLQLQAVKKETGSITSVDVEIKNISNFETNAHLYIRSGDENGAVLKEYDLGSMAAASVKNVTIQGQEVAGLAKAGEVLYLEAVSENEEAYYSNNGSYVYVEKEPVRSLQLTKKEITLSGIGSKFTLQASVEPKNATDSSLTWTSKNVKVASVSSAGVVTAMGIGTTQIIASAKDGSGVTAICNVTVTKKENILVSSIKLNAASKTLNIRKTFTLNPNVSPSNATNKSLSYSSNNSSVATVNSKGVITAKKAGKAIITVTARDGSKKKAQCTIYVKPSMPKSLKVKKNTDASVKISWKKVSNATGYEVYRSTKQKSGFKKIKTLKGVKKVSLINGKLKRNKTYYYKVCAYKTVGKKKIYSNYSGVYKIKM